MISEKYIHMDMSKRACTTRKAKITKSEQESNQACQMDRYNQLHLLASLFFTLTVAISWQA